MYTNNEKEKEDSSGNDTSSSLNLEPQPSTSQSAITNGKKFRRTWSEKETKKIWKYLKYTIIMYYFKFFF